MKTEIRGADWIAALLLAAAWWSDADACDREIPQSQMQASASVTLAGSSPANLVDGSLQTLWSSGTYAQQWVQVDLGSKRPLCKLRLTVSQSPAATVKHTVLIGDTPQSLVEFSVIQQYAADMDTIDVPIMANTRYVRIRTDSSPSWVAWRELRAFSSQTVALPANASGLKHYGFWMSGGYVDTDANIHTIDDATVKVRGFTNFTMATAQNFESRVAELDDPSAKVVIDASWIFLAANYAAAWDAQNMSARLQAYGSRIAAIIPLDEPDNNAAFDDASVTQRIQFLKSKLATLGLNIPVYVDYSYLAFGSGKWHGLASADWVSFNCYPQDHHPGSTLWNRYDLCYQNRSLAGDVDALKARLGPNQRILLIPQSFYRVPLGSNPTQATAVPANDKKFMVENIDLMMEIAENDPKVVGIMNFIYQPVDDAEAWIGAEWLTDAATANNVNYRLMEAGLCVRAGLLGCPLRRLRPVSVAASGGAASAGNAFDDRSDTAWNAGGFSTATQKQWIRAELPRAAGVAEIRLTPLQTPTCATTTHEIWGGATAAGLTRIAEFTGNTCDGATFVLGDFWRNNDLKVIEVRTISSPSWVAWREIQFYR